MWIRVLGSAAGGGFPQWNCNCVNCHGLRSGTIQATPRTQSSITVSADGESWVLFNASPDIRSQLESFPQLQPARAVRDTGIVAVVLIDSQIDHATGLVVLRESNRPLQIFCTDMAYQDLTTGFPLLSILEHYCGVERHSPPLDGESSFTVPGAANLRFTAVPLTSKAPPYSPHRHEPHVGDNIGVRIEDTTQGTNAFYAPGLGEVEPHIVPFMEQADCLLVDGTCWTEDEMQQRVGGTKRSSEMGHLAQSGAGGMIEHLDRLKRPRKILIHINNTNPILDEASPERAELTAHGIEVSYDGMDIRL